jgi:hypothetical protein
LFRPVLAKKFLPVRLTHRVALPKWVAAHLVVHLKQPKRLFIFRRVHLAAAQGGA